MMAPSWFEPMISKCVVIVPTLEKWLWMLTLEGFQRMASPPEVPVESIDM
jgi:hypothetical protein